MKQTRDFKSQKDIDKIIATTVKLIVFYRKMEQQLSLFSLFTDLFSTISRVQCRVYYLLFM